MSEDTNEVRRISVSEAHALVDAGRGVLVDVRDRPPDRVLILYCA